MSIRSAMKSSNPEPLPLIGGASARKLKAHPAADLFPMMSDAELNDLAMDVKSQGQRRPIVLLDGLILDGRNRYEACRRAGIEPRLEQWTGASSPTAFVLSENLQRRHLTVDQRALIALEAQPLFAGEAKARQRAAGGDRKSAKAPDRLPPRGGNRSAERAPTAAAEAAQTAGVSARSVERARRVQVAQPAILDRVRAGTMTLKQAEKAVVKGERLKEVLAYQPPKGRFAVIVADPPWRYDDTLDGSDLARGGLQYPTMSVEEICAMKVGETLATPDCALWLWVTNAFLIDGTATRVVREWGFTPKALLTWDKGRWGAGRYLRNQTEHAILAIRGKPMVSGESHGTLLQAPRTGHSVKPGEAFALFEAVTPAAAEARLELFARETRKGWITSGSELHPKNAKKPEHGITEGAHVWLRDQHTALKVGAVGVAMTVEALFGDGRVQCVWSPQGSAGRREIFRAEDLVIAVGKPNRPPKKFPLQSGLTEKCTECGAELGDHAGTKCPFPADKLSSRVGPFQAHVNETPVGPLHKDRSAAVQWAKEQGHRRFTVTWANGEVCDYVDLPAPAPKNKKPAKTKAKRARK